MAEVKTPAPPRRPRDDATFTRDLRWEVMGEEGRALVGSWVVAVAVGVAWLLLVWLFPPAPPKFDLLPEDERGVTLTFEDPPPEAIPEAPVTRSPVAPTPQPQTARPQPQRPGGGGQEGGQRSAQEIGAAFGTASGSGTGGMVGDVTNILRGVDVSSGSGGTGAAAGGGRAVLATGEGGAGSRTPGRGGLGAGGEGTSGIGGVGSGAGGGGVGRAEVAVAAPRVVAPPVGGGPGRDVGELGNFVRSRESQLRFCYQEYGLKVNPRLAGSVSINIVVAGNGAVSGANISRRTWSGAGASEAESCIQSRIRGWRFPTSSTGEGTYGFSFNFSPAG
jgi:hypothetical protein